MFNKSKKEKDNNIYYEFNKEYSVIEIVVKDGQTIPKYGDRIPVHQHDEIMSIDFNIIVHDILERKLVNNKLVLLIEYSKIDE
jgi:hypothetical protein